MPPLQAVDRHLSDAAPLGQLGWREQAPLSLDARAEQLLATRRVLLVPAGDALLIEASDHYYYRVTPTTCCCPAFARNGQRCKHTEAARILLGWLTPRRPPARTAGSLVRCSARASAAPAAIAGGPS